MLGIKLVDVDTSEAQEEQTGTCESCFGSMWCDNPVLIFENPYGDRVEIDGYFWIWGDYFELEIDNYLNFSDWLSKQDVDWNMLKEDGHEYLADLVNWYREENENDQYLFSNFSLADISDVCVLRQEETSKICDVWSALLSY